MLKHGDVYQYADSLDKKEYVVLVKDKCEDHQFLKEKASDRFEISLDELDFDFLSYYEGLKNYNYPSLNLGRKIGNIFEKERKGETNMDEEFKELMKSAPPMPQAVVEAYIEAQKSNDPDCWELPWNEYCLKKLAYQEYRWRKAYAEVMSNALANKPKTYNDYF